jgi:hypothetical protein
VADPVPPLWFVPPPVPVAAGADVRVGRGVAAGASVRVGVGAAAEPEAVGEAAADGAPEVPGVLSDEPGCGDVEAEGTTADGDAPLVEGDVVGLDDPDGGGVAEGVGLGLTVFGAIAKAAVQTWDTSQNGSSAGQPATASAEVTRTVYCVCPNGRSPNGWSLMTSPPGPPGHEYQPVSCGGICVIAPPGSTWKVRSASVSLDNVTDPVSSLTSKK